MRRFAALWSLIALGCSAGGARQSYVVGAGGPWTQSFGIASRQGIELARDEINAGGGINGKKFEIIFLDDSGSGSVAARVAKQFVDNPAVLGVVGHASSAPMMAAARVYDGHLAAVVTTATTPALTGVSPWIFRVCASDSANGAMLAGAATALRLKRAAILYENDDYGRGLSTSFRTAFKGQVVSSDPIAGDISNAEPYIAWFRKTQPDVVFVAGNDVSALVILREARRQGLKTQFMGGDGWTPVIADTAASDGALVGTPFTAEDARPEARKFVEAFNAKFKMNPDENAALGYDATITLAQAIRTGGADRDAIRARLHALDAGSAVKGATGPIRFRPDGDPIGKGSLLARARGGRLIVERAP